MSPPPCPTCGTAVAEDDSICTSCGAVVDTNVFEEATRSVFVQGPPAALRVSFVHDDVEHTFVADGSPPADDGEGFDPPTDEVTGIARSSVPPSSTAAPAVTASAPPAAAPVATVAPVAEATWEPDTEQVDVLEHPELVLRPPGRPTPPAPLPPPPPVAPLPSPDDLVALFEEHTGAMAMSGEGAPIFEPATPAVAHDVTGMCEPNVVLAVKDGVDPSTFPLSPFEKHVLQLIDGQRPVARIRKKSRLVMSDLKIAIGLLGDRGVIVAKGSLRPDLRALVDPNDLDESGERALPLGADGLPQLPAEGLEIFGDWPDVPSDQMALDPFSEDAPLTAALAAPRAAAPGGDDVDAQNPVELPADALIPLAAPAPAPPADVTQPVEQINFFKRAHPAAEKK